MLHYSYLLVLLFLLFGDSLGLVGHIIPHSHDDVGWILTIDEYYDLLVQHIYNEVIQALADQPHRRFIAVEMAFFSKWWDETATVQQQQQARALVANGQLEFVIGGWTMEDEACTTYSTNIDQMTVGHRWIYDRFGVVPRHGAG
jgi:alpha-mannosidase